MNLKEVKKQVYFNLWLYVIIGVCLLLSLFAILTIPVKAVEQTTYINNDIHSSTLSNCGRGANGTYCATQTNNQVYSRSVGTTYNGVLSCIDFEFDYYFHSNSTNTLTIETNTNDFRNNSIYAFTESYTTYPGNATNDNSSFRYISNKKVQFVIPYNAQQTHRVVVCGNPLTGISNYNIKSISLTYDDGNQDLTGIIDNATSNTTDIINNNNSNTQDIINSVETANLVCKKDTNMYDYIFHGGFYLENNGTIIPAPYYGYTDFIRISGTQLTFNGLDGTNYHLLFFDENYNVLGAYGISNQNYTIPSNAVYMKFSLSNTNVYLFKLHSDGCIYIDSTNTLINKEDETLDYLKDDSNPSVNQSDIDNVISDVQVQDPLNYLLTLPLNLLTKLNTLISSGTCNRVSFGQLYGTELFLPCINFENFLGSSLWSTIDTIVGIGLLVIILKKFYDTISNILSLGKEEEIRKGMELPTPMEFLAQILGGGK